VLVDNLDECSNSIERELRRHHNQVARIHWLRSADHWELGPIRLGWRGRTAREMPVYMRVRKRVPHIEHVLVTLIVECGFHPLKELLGQ
jgi:hypothetical protein